MTDPKHVKHHHILPVKQALVVGAALLVLTFITVAVAHVDLGRFNFLIAMVVASIKATLVALIFMNLAYDKKENAVIFVTSFLFLAIFISLTVTDLFFRGDVYVKGPLNAGIPQGKSKFKKAWMVTPELVSHGRELFNAQCTSCHGPNGHGDGPAAGSLAVKPRNFTAAEGWKNGRRPSEVFKTLKEGLPGGMPSFASLPAEDRWALAHYVLTLGPAPGKDTLADLAKVGVDPNKADSGGAEEATIPVEIAMQQMADPEPKLTQTSQAAVVDTTRPGGHVYAQNCASCHGARGQGGIRVANLGVNPKVIMTTSPLSESETLRNPDAFNRVVTRGIQGGLMPGFGQLSSSELRDLHSYVNGAK